MICSSLSLSLSRVLSLSLLSFFLRPSCNSYSLLSYPNPSLLISNYMIMYISPQEYISGQPTSKVAVSTQSPRIQHHTISTATTRNSSSFSSHTPSVSGSSSNPHSRPSEHGSSSTGSSSPTLRSSGTYEVVGFDSGKEDQDDDWLEPPPAEVGHS